MPLFRMWCLWTQYKYSNGRKKILHIFSDFTFVNTVKGSGMDTQIHLLSIVLYYVSPCTTNHNLCGHKDWR